MEIQHAPDKAAGYYGQSEISQVPGINHRLTGHDRFRDAFHDRTKAMKPDNGLANEVFQVSQLAESIN